MSVLSATAISIIAGIRQRGGMIYLVSQDHFTVTMESIPPATAADLEQHRDAIWFALIAEARLYGRGWCRDCGIPLQMAAPFTGEAAICRDCAQNKVTFARLSHLWHERMTMPMVGLS